MNRKLLLLAVSAVLAGCQSNAPEQGGEFRSVYSGDSSVLYQVQKQADSPLQAMQLAARAYQAGNLDMALFQYLRVVELDPKRHSAMVWVGRIHRERGNAQLAEMAFGDVLASDPDNPEALSELGLLYLAGRNHAKAREMFSRALAVDQKRLGRSADALAVDQLEVDGQSPLKVYNALGVLADLGDDFAQAEAYYRLAMRIEPRSALVHNSQGYSYYLAGQWPEAERMYQRGISYDPSYKPLWRNYGLLLARMERYEEAVSAFEQVEPRAEASNDVGYVCLVAGRLDEAEQFFRSAIDQAPGHYATAWDNLNRVEQIRRIRQIGGGGTPEPEQPVAVLQGPAMTAVTTP
ncbi:type IV pilus biogenesis/stability protein PilW [compost metagenome]